MALPHPLGELIAHAANSGRMSAARYVLPCGNPQNPRRFHAPFGGRLHGAAIQVRTSHTERPSAGLALVPPLPDRAVERRQRPS